MNDELEISLNKKVDIVFDSSYMYDYFKTQIIKRYNRVIEKVNWHLILPCYIFTREKVFVS